MSRAQIIVLGAVVVCIGGLSACGGGSGDVVARVGESPITNATVDHWAWVLAGSGTAERPSPRRPALRGRVLGFLISSQWLLGEAGELGVKVTDKDAQDQLELLRYDRLEGLPYEGLPRRGELPVLFAKARSRADRLWLMKLAILARKVQSRRLTDAESKITKAQIASYYAGHKSSFVAPERRDLQWVVTYHDATTRKAMREIRSGKSFLSVAERLSLDPPTISGLELASSPEQQFARRIFAAKPHVLVGPFYQAPVNHYVFEVTKVTPARQRTLAQSEASIRRQLAARWVATLPAALERKWASRTSCRPGYVAQRCTQLASTIQSPS